MQKARQLRQQCAPLRRLFADVLPQAAPADLFRHPAFQIRLRRDPQIEIRVEVAAQAFDVQQGFLQQDQLRLDLDVEAPRSLEQAQQHLAERDLLERPVEDRFTHRAYRRLELLDTRIGRNPARLDMYFRDAPVIAPEKGEEVLREVVLVHLVERAHDAEVERDVAAVGRHQDVPRVHVGVKEPVAENLREENLDAGTRELRDLDAQRAQFTHLADRHADHALHDHDLGAAEVPEYFRHEQQRRVVEIAAQLAGVGRLAHQIEFVLQMPFELGHHFPGLEPAAVRPELLDKAGGDIEQRDVLDDDRRNSRTQNLDGDFESDGQHGEMDLRHRSAGDCHRIETFENLVDRQAVGAFQRAIGLFDRERRHSVLQPGELISDIERDQIAPRRQHLAELDEYRSERFKCEAQAFAAWTVELAAEQRRRQQQPQAANAPVTEEEFVKPVAQRYTQNFQQAQQTHRG